jgi:hypothetical protein
MNRPETYSRMPVEDRFTRMMDDGMSFQKNSESFESAALGLRIASLEV